MNSPPRESFEVIVVGGDPVALATALTLARRGVDVMVLDNGSPPRLPWTEVHHWSVLGELERLGVLGALLEQGSRCREWALRVLATGEQITYRLGDLGPEVVHPYHLRVDETVLRRVLQQALGRAGIPIRRQARVESLRQRDEGVALTTDEGTRTGWYAARWVVGADGTSSVVRREAGLGFPGTTWTERYVAAVVDHDFASMGYADVTLQVDGSLGAVVERMDANRWRYLFAEPLGVPEEDVRERAGEVLRTVLGSTPRILDWTASRMHQRCADDFREGRVLLVGDAAHVTQRMIGHSSISAWMDGFTLGRRLADVVQGRASEGLMTDWAEARRRIFLDDANPLSLGRKNLVSQITDPQRLDVELDQFRRATHDADVRREVLLQGAELSGTSVAPLPVA